MRRVGRFLENHVEKIVLVVVGVVCAVLFFRNVIFSPNVVQVGDRGLPPGRIDRVILEQARELERNINTTTVTQSAPSYTSVLTGPIGPNHPVIAGVLDDPLPKGFMGLFASPLESLGGRAPVMQPGRAVVRSGRKYKLPPEIGSVTDVGINYIRAAAWVPVQEVTPQDNYDKVAVEANDIDLVTVEAKFDVAELYRRFRSYFAGVEVPKPEWRDPCLAEPVFAAVQLQRSALQEDGSWGDWQEVPRSRVEANRELFRVIERVDDLPSGGMQVRLMQFKPKRITMSLLQPEAYQIASAEEDWFPPSFYDRYKTLQKKVEMEEKREQRESNRDQQDRADGRYREGRTGGVAGGQTGGTGGRYRSSTSGTLGGSSTGGRTGRLRGSQTQQDPAYGGGAYGDQAGTRLRGTSTRGRGRLPQDEAALYGDMAYGQGTDPRKASTDEVYLDLISKMITYRTDLSRVEESLLFWAFDDTAEPGGTYRYRVRLGVFNPVAGTDQVVEQDLARKDQVILWSNFSEVTKPVEIPRKLYFFAKDVQEAKRSATVEVARYMLGYWRSEDFEVKPGEVIGREMKPRTQERRRTSPLSSRITDPAYAGGAPPVLGLGVPADNLYGAGPAENIPTPEWIDYRTGNVLVDLVQVSDWGEPPALRPRMYHEMLYTRDGERIEHMPAGVTNWPKRLASAYQHVKTEARREPQPFRAFKKGGIRSRMPTGAGYEGMEGMMYDESMYMEMGGAGPYQ